MRISQIRIENVRNIKEATINPGLRLNIILGANGSGKSSLLESIHLLGRADSFRTNRYLDVIQRDTTRLGVSGLINTEGNLTHRINVVIDKKRRSISIDGTETGSRSELIKRFPLQFLSPLSYLLIEGPPNVRRQFIDWGVFHSQRPYPEEWKRFRRCLIQRNAALKTKNRSMQGIWNDEFAKYGTIISERRKDYLDQVLPYVQDISDQMLPTKKVSLAYLTGWDDNLKLDQVLENDLERDMKFGFTHSGPHKSDLLVTVHGRPGRSFLSRGQIKLLVIAMKLAQIKLLMDQKNRCTSLLIDDFCTELDRRNATRLKHFLHDIELQCFLTATDRNSIGSFCGIDSTLFHVEQGHVRTI